MYLPLCFAQFIYPNELYCNIKILKNMLLKECT